MNGISTADLIGSTGVALLLGAFALNLAGRLQRDGAAYAGLNVLGSGLAAAASALIGYWPFIVLESAWCAVSCGALIRLAMRSV
ncbi:MAG: hypothetical protein IV086_09175 [Hyphomonadaceae bacterium]|nr:hypothetical protein [Hyphomonadaceae bacterium]